MSDVPKVSVIVTARNYASYLPTCIESVLGQTFEDFEIVVVDDGSTDDTQAVLARYGARLRVLRTEGVGLAAASNLGIQASAGRYVMRLDADDYVDENILLVESTVLDRRPEIGLVYPDYYRVGATGEVLDCVRLMKVEEPGELLDRTPLAAGAMYRRECFEALGGYDERLRYQEDYDFWMRFTRRFRVMNVGLPLMYYRQHGRNMSSNFPERMQARGQVKRALVESAPPGPQSVLGFIPARAWSHLGGKLPLKALGGRSLLSYTVEEALRVRWFDRVIVSTDDAEVAEEARRLGAAVPFLRPASLSGPSVPVDEVLHHALGELRAAEDYHPSIIVLLHVVSPFKRAEHITEAIDTLLLHAVDSVISVCEDRSFRWRPGPGGLVPVGFDKRHLRQDREIQYRENGAIYVIRRDAITRDSLLGSSTAWIEMGREESLHLESEFDFWIAERLIEEGLQAGPFRRRGPEPLGR